MRIRWPVAGIFAVYLSLTHIVPALTVEQTLADCSVSVHAVR